MSPSTSNESQNAGKSTIATGSNNATDTPDLLVSQSSSGEHDHLREQTDDENFQVRREVLYLFVYFSYHIIFPMGDSTSPHFRVMNF